MWIIRKFVNWLLDEVEVTAREIRPGDAVYKGEDGRYYRSRLELTALKGTENETDS